MTDAPIDINELFSDAGYSPEAPKVEAKKEETPEPDKKIVEEEEEEEEVTEETKDSSPQTSSIISFLVEQGILSEDPGDVDSETLAEIVEQETENYVKEALDATFESWKQKLPSNVMGLIQHTFNGGDVEEYMKTWNETPLSLFDISNESGQEAFLRYYYKSVEGLDEDEIRDKIDWHIDRDNISSAAKRFYQKAASDRDKKLELLAKQQVDAKQKAEQQAQERRQKMLQGMAKVKDFDGYQFPEGEKKVLQQYATRPVVVEGKTFSSGLAADLYEALGDPQKVMFLSKLLKGNFDTSFIKKKGSTEAIRKVKKTLEQPIIDPLADDGVIWD